MGIEGPIIADLPKADTRPVVPILMAWFFRTPDLYVLATFGIRHIESNIRSWMPEPGDGLSFEMRWTGWGCRIDFIYGFFDGIEFLQVTRLTGSDCPPSCDRIEQLATLALSPDRTCYVRLPDPADRTINRVPAWHAAEAPSDVTAPSTSEPLPARAGTVPAAIFRVYFAPPWLPAAYLAAQIPKDLFQHTALESRHPADLERNFEMKDFAQIAYRASSLPGALHFAVNRIHAPASTGATLRFAMPDGIAAGPLAGFAAKAAAASADCDDAILPVMPGLTRRPGPDAGSLPVG